MLPYGNLRAFKTSQDPSLVSHAGHQASLVNRRLKGKTAVQRGSIHRVQQLSRVIAAAAGHGGRSGSSREDEIWQQLSKMADKYLLAGPAGVLPYALAWYIYGVHEGYMSCSNGSSNHAMHARDQGIQSCMHAHGMQLRCLADAGNII